ncbi:hypothetical protein F4860DRAFT_460707 [Xylaria cubensis]|nr:hypothetical protein F4860DRAFT_460707 [Xylaria cubensis]
MLIPKSHPKKRCTKRRVMRRADNPASNIIACQGHVCRRSFGRHTERRVFKATQSSSSQIQTGLFSVAQLFSLSNGPAFLVADPPLVRDIYLAAGSSLWRMNEGYWKPGSGHWSKAYYIRYPFIRPRKQRIAVDGVLPDALDLRDLQLIRLKEFLVITALEVDPAIIDPRLVEAAKKLSHKPYYEPLPPVLEPLSVITQPNMGFLAEMLKGRGRPSVGKQNKNSLKN